MEDVKISEEPVKKKLSENTVFQIIGLGIPFLYLFGYLYMQGYFATYGISLEILPQNPDQYLTSLFSLVANTVFKSTEIFIALISFIFFILLLTALLLYLFTRLMDYLILRVEKRFSKKESKISNAAQEALNFLEKGLILAIKFSALLLAIMSLSLSGILVYAQGMEVSQKQKGLFEHCEMKKLSIKKECDFLLDGYSVKYKGLLFGASDTHYGIWDGDKTHIVPISNLVLEVRHGEMPIDIIKE